MQVLNEFAAVLRRKFRLEWDLVVDALADVREAPGPCGGYVRDPVTAPMRAALRATPVSVRTYRWSAAL